MTHHPDTTDSAFLTAGSLLSYIMTFLVGPEAKALAMLISIIVGVLAIISWTLKIRYQLKHKSGPR